MVQSRWSRDPDAGRWLDVTWDGVLGPELGEVRAEGCRQLAALETLGELLAGGDLALVTAGRSHQPRQDAALGHLQPLQQYNSPL